MKRNPREQLVGLLEGLNLPAIIEGKSLLDHLDSSPRELKATGEMISRLSQIGASAINKEWEQAQEEKQEKHSL